MYAVFIEQNNTICVENQLTFSVASVRCIWGPYPWLW